MGRARVRPNSFTSGVSKITHGCSGPLLAPDDQISMSVADLKLPERAALVVDVADDRSRAVLAAAGAHASRRVVAAQQFNLGGAVHRCFCWELSKEF